MTRREVSVATDDAAGCECMEDPALVAEIVAEASAHGSLIAVLQRVQARFGYLPEPLINEIARLCDVPASRIYGIITFYAQFTTKRTGRFKIHVCVGTACHVAGVSRVTQALRDELGVDDGETTDDWLATLQTVSCVGACALAPVVRVNDDETYGKATPASMRKLVADLRERAKDEEA